MSIQSIIAFLELVIGFGFLIFVHELGHFMVAKWVGIKCPQFAIGFGTAMLSWRKGIGIRKGSTEDEYEKRVLAHLHKNGTLTNEKDEPTVDQIDQANKELGLGETEYRLNYLPLGGYVKMLGQEDLDAGATSNDPRSYNNKPIWARACVISAGVVMNMIFGFIFFIWAFQIGVPFPPAVVGGIDKDMPAATTYAMGHEGDPAYRGLKLGDVIKTIDGKPTNDMTDLRVAAALGEKDVPLTLTVDRYNVKEPLTYKITPVPNPLAENLLGVGVIPSRSTNVAGITPNNPLYAQGLRDNMKLVEINNQPITAFAQAYYATQSLKGSKADFTFEGKDAQRINLELAGQPTLTFNEDGQQNLIGMVPAASVLAFVNNSALEAAGGQVGDVLAKINNTTWPDTDTAAKLIREAGDENALQITMLRQGKLVDLKPIHTVKNKLGFYFGLATNTTRVSKVLKDSPAEAMNLTAGSTIEQINGKKVANWNDMQLALGQLQTTAEQPVQVAIMYQLNIANNPTETSTVTIPADSVKQIADAGWTMPAALDFQQLLETVIAKNPVAASKLGLEKTYQFVQQTYITLLRLFQGSVGVSNLRGPVGIVDVGTQAAQKGFSWLLFFLGLISVNLAVINFLPLPIVDGGHIVFLIIEKIKGSPASPAVQIAAMWVGLALIGTIFVVVTYHDIVRLAGSWFS